MDSQFSLSPRALYNLQRVWLMFGKADFLLASHDILLFDLLQPFYLYILPALFSLVYIRVKLFSYFFFLPRFVVD